MNILIGKEFGKETVTRESGERLRKMIVKGLGEGEKVVVDFAGTVIASTSFFDEGLAKLGEEKLEPSTLESSLSVTGLHRRDRELLGSLCKRRQIRIPVA